MPRGEGPAPCLEILLEHTPVICYNILTFVEKSDKAALLPSPRAIKRSTRDAPCLIFFAVHCIFAPVTMGRYESVKNNQYARKGVVGFYHP